MKNSFLVKALALILLCSAMNTFSMNAGSRNENGDQAKKDKSMQRMLLMMGGSALGYGLVHYFADKWKFPEAGTILNVSRKGIKAGFTLSGSLAGLSMISNEEWSKTFRSAALRVWMMPFVGAIISHPKVHEGLGYIPFGLGQWFKDNPPSNQEIGAIYAISMWAMMKPTIDKGESKLIAQLDKV